MFSRRELERRPVSSGYIQAHDLANVPEPKSIIPPFEDVLKFKSQYEEDGLYIDLVRIIGRLFGESSFGYLFPGRRLINNNFSGNFIMFICAKTRS